MSACLDSWAILAWLDGDEPATTRVEALLPERPVVSWVNLVEVYYRDATAERVAARLGVPAGTVRSRLYYALRAVRDRLAELAAADPALRRLRPA